MKDKQYTTFMSSTNTVGIAIPTHAWKRFARKVFILNDEPDSYGNSALEGAMSAHEFQETRKGIHAETLVKVMNGMSEIDSEYMADEQDMFKWCGDISRVLDFVRSVSVNKVAIISWETE